MHLGIMPARNHLHVSRALSVYVLLWYLLTNNLISIVYLVMHNLVLSIILLVYYLVLYPINLTTTMISTLSLTLLSISCVHCHASYVDKSILISNLSTLVYWIYSLTHSLYPNLSVNVCISCMSTLINTTMLNTYYI